MTELDEKDKSLVDAIVKEILSKKEEEESDDKVEEPKAKPKKEEPKEDAPEITEEPEKSVSATTKDFKYPDMYGASSGKSLRELDFNAPHESDDWKHLTCDLLRAAYQKDYAWLSAYQQKVASEVMVEGTAALGGNIVPTEFLAEVQRRAAVEEVIYPRARIIRMNRYQIDIPSEAGSGPKFEYTSEAALKSTTSNEWGSTTLTAYKVAAIKVGSDELFADAAIDLMPYIVEEFARSLADFRDREFLTGSTISGIDSYTFTTVAAGGALTGDHLISAMYSLKPYYRSRAVWLMHTNTLATIRALKVNNEANHYALMTLDEGGNPTVLGRPAFTIDYCDQNKIFLIDLSTYIVGDRQTMTIDVSNEATMEAGTSPYSLWQRDLTGIRVVTRIGGCMVQTEGCVEISGVRT